MNDLRKSIEPKSDQLNADDLLGTTKTITVTKVARGTADQPVFIHYDGENGRPYKPCKSMRRVLIGAWGDNGADWVGRSMTLYCDPSVKFGGVAVGGIRISHLTHIERDLSMMLTATRGKKSEYMVKAMAAPTKQMYPSDLFDERLAAIIATVNAKKMTVDQAIERCEQTGLLTDEQKKQIIDGVAQ